MNGGLFRFLCDAAFVDRVGQEHDVVFHFLHKLCRQSDIGRAICPYVGIERFDFGTVAAAGRSGDEVQHGVEEGQVFGVVENGKRNSLNFCVCSHDFDFKGC